MSVYTVAGTIAPLSTDKQAERAGVGGGEWRNNKKKQEISFAYYFK